MIVGIDLGGTKTRIVAESDGDTVLDTVVPTNSWQRGELLDDDTNGDRLLALFAHLEGAATASVAIGAHGLDSDWQTREFNARMVARHGGRVLAVNDVELVAPAAGLERAIAVIVGTGSKIVGHDESGAVVSAGGHGFLLSDPGSAASLARDAVRAVLDAHDDGDEPDVLGRDLMAYFEVGDVVDLSYAFTADARMSSWAALGPLVFDSAEAGSQIATSVIDESARLLARDVGRVHARGAIGTNVICAGGVITNQPSLYRALTRHIDNLGLRLTVDLLTVAPVLGAVALARKLHNLSTAQPI
ncbi:MAG: BadF-type ATPase [Glaciihabitans sp.]|nr:BadF-type ATPase [Glaciihabitans sp.]